MKELIFLEHVGGERAGIRTLDLLIKSQLLYRLSYALPWGEGRLSKVRGTYARAIERSTEKWKVLCLSCGFKSRMRKGDWHLRLSGARKAHNSQVPERFAS